MLCPFRRNIKVAVVDGVTMHMDCNLTTLPAGCASLRLSGRGGKAKCLKQMVDHLKAQALITAHGATVKLQAEEECQPHGQSKPEEPSAGSGEPSIDSGTFQRLVPLVCSIQVSAGQASA